ncbi:MAG: hypothetical protein RLN96_11010, partial [Pseudomonadales bacterium]
DEITIDYDPGSTEEVTLHDGSVIHLHKAESEYDAHDREAAINTLQRYKTEGKILTGLIYLDPQAPDFHEMMGTTATPLNQLREDALCPGSSALARINAALS